MPGWHEGILVSFDCETSGVDVETARIVTAAVVTINPRTGDVDTQQWLADPGVEIPDEASAVHGITTEMARADGRPADEVVDVAKHYGIELSELDAHGAAADALAAARVAWKLARKYPALGAMSHAELFANQVVWYREQATSLARYFASQGKDEHVPTEWPIRPVPTAVA